MHRMFYRCNNLKSVGKLDNWDISNVTNIRGMFTYDSKLTTVGDLSKWNTSKVNNMGWLFYCCPGLTTVGDLSKWDVSNVTEMDYMFSDCTQMNNIGDISKWNTAKVTTMNHMFYNTLALIDIDISGFSGTSLINTNSMFAYSGAKSIKMGNLSNTSVSADSSTEMFSHCSNLKSVTLGPNWSFKTTESSLDSATTSNSNILPDDTTYYGKWESNDGKKSYPSAKAFAKAWTSAMAGTWNYTTDWTTEGQNVSKTKADGDTDITHQAGTYLVTVPTRITFSGMPVGKVNQDISYSVNVRGNLATGKYIHLATKTSSDSLSSIGIGLSFNQGKTVWSKENAYGTVNPDGSNMGTNSTDSVSLTGEVKSVGKYTGLITYESSMTDSDK